MAFARRLTHLLPLAALLLANVGCQPPAAALRDLRLWAVSDLAEATPDDRPRRDTAVYSDTRGIQLVAAMRETVAFQLLLRHDTATAPAAFDITLTDLRSRAAVLPADQVARRFRVTFTTLDTFPAWYPRHTGRSAVPRLVADALVPWDAPRGGGPALVEPGAAAIVWFDLNIPAGTPPGTYQAELRITPTAGGAARTIPLTIQVLPLTLPAEPALPVVAQLDPRGLLAAHFSWPPQPAAETRLIRTAPQHQAARRLLDHFVQQLRDHRLAPALFAAFPKYRPAAGRDVALEWDDYDALVADWVSGAAFPDRGRLTHWPLPATAEYPDAERNGGFASARYARLLRAYLTAAAQHFRANNWSPNTFFRPLPPQPLSPVLTERLRRLTGIVSGITPPVPLVAHVPPRSLAPLGWWNAPPIPDMNPGIWAPPARWFEPEALQRARTRGAAVWFIPDEPPYSPSLALAALPADPRALGWQAYRYQVDGIWLEDVAPTPPSQSSAAHHPLVYPGAPFGLFEQTIPTVRLKRLRRGLLDHALLDLLDRNGMPTLADRTAARLVRWGFTEAAITNLLDTRPAGWPADPTLYERARQVILAELVSATDPAARTAPINLARLRADWARVASQADRVLADLRGVRLQLVDEQLVARVQAVLLNASDQPLAGTWRPTAPPTGWRFRPAAPVSAAPGARVATFLESTLAGLAYNESGAYPFDLQFDSETRGSFPTRGRLAVATVPLVNTAPRIDGRLDDWQLATSNTAGDFLLVRGTGLNDSRRPALPTQAYFALTDDQLFIAVRCRHPADEPPRWQASNFIPLDGAVPWGEDLIEILLAPENPLVGTAADLRVLQIKPSGLLVARRGALTDPPLCPATPWESGARVAVARAPDEWVVELSLPLADLGPAATQNRIWGLNVTRLDARRGEYSSWSGAQGYTYAPDLLGNVVLLRP